MNRTPIVIIGAVILVVVAIASLLAKANANKKPAAKDTDEAKKTPSKTNRRAHPENLEGLRDNAIASFEETKTRAVAAGSTHYIWRSCGDSDVCVVCSTNNGRKFRWDHPHHHGHPGFGCRSSNGHCRCYAEPIIRS